MNKVLLTCVTSMFTIIGLLQPCRAADALFVAENGNPYLNMSIEDLMQVQVSIASKKPQSLSDIAAAVFVLTGEDILRSGATSLPEALRLVPGIEVARGNGHTWAVSARGFASSFSSGLLVMIDGRSVFTPLFGGVYWDVQNIMLEDIDKIEVVRGSGGAVWGANAVNGVINIITKSAQDTQGGLLVVGAGDSRVENGFGGLRYGFKLGEAGAARIFAKGFSRQDDNVRASAPIGNWQDKRLGFRADWDMNTSTFMLSGGMYGGHESTVSTLMFATPPYSEVTTYQSDVSGSHLLGLWQREGLSVQTYIDRTRRTRRTFSEHRNTFDLEVKYHAKPFVSHDLQWGLGYRTTSDRMTNSLALSFNPISKTDPLYSVFIQDEITLLPSLRLTLGLKVEDNNYTGVESAPDIRLMWEVSDKQRLWASASHAYVPPTRADADMSQLFVNTPNFQLGLVPNKNLKTIDIESYELGYRFQPQAHIAFEAVAYRNKYRHLLTDEKLPFDPILGFSGIQEGNFLNAKSKGVELNMSWQVLDQWRLTANYAWIQIRSYSTGGTDLVSYQKLNTVTPNHRWSVNSALALSNQFTLDAQLYVVAESLARKVEAYTRADLRLGWNVKDTINVSLAIQNALDKKHAEFPDVLGNQTLFGRSYYGQMNWKF